MLCQVCTAVNEDDAEYCRRCRAQAARAVWRSRRREDVETEADEGEGFSLEEHLLERISILEEVVKRSSESMSTLLGALRKQEETSWSTTPV